MNFSTAITYVKTHLGATIVLVIVGGGVLWWGTVALIPEKISYDTVRVSRQDVKEVVNVTGKVEGLQEADLGFVKSGRVNHIYVLSGDSVQGGDRLIALENDDLQAQYVHAQEQVRAEAERLSEMQRGTRPEEITVQKAEVESARTALVSTKQDLYQTLRDAYTRADDAVRNKADQFFSNPRGVPSLIIPQKGHETLDDDRRAIEDMLLSWETQINELTVGSNLDVFAGQTVSHLTFIKNFLTELASLVNRNDVGTTATERDLLYTGRLNVDTAISSVVSDQKALDEASASLTLEDAQLALLKAGTREERLQAQEAQMFATEATAREYKALVEKTILRAPFDGRIVRQDIRIGEVVEPGTTLVSIISRDVFKVTLYVPEADIAKIVVGDSVTFTLDAFESNVIFLGVVTDIDRAETVIEGVPTYKVTVSLDKTERDIRSGMTADVDILAGEHLGALAIPARSIIRNGTESYVYVLAPDGVPKKQTVKTGLRDSEGQIEIISGLSEGDVVITSAVE